MKQYEVTIGIPVYNVEKYIRQTIDSVLEQIFPSIEFIFLDDCGTDSSIDIVREYQQTHPRGKDIRIVRQPQNKGIGEGRNRIIDEATGKYLYFLDADDTIEPNTIQLLYENALRYNAEIVYGSHERIEMFGEEVKHMPRQFASMQFLNSDEFASWAYDAYDNLPAMTWNFLIDISVFRKNKLRYQPVNYWEDFVMTMDLPIYITRAVLLPDIIYHYYCRYGSLSNFAKRNHIDKAEIDKTISAMLEVKKKSEHIKYLPYFGNRMNKVMMTHFYMSCAILKANNIIIPPFSKQEIRNIMRWPLPLLDVLKTKGCGVTNLILYSLGVLPPTISVCIIRVIGWMKGLL